MLQRVYKTINGRSHCRFVPIKEKNIESDRMSAADVLIGDIFVIDPVTQYPKSDISMFLSSETSPEVKQFIQEQLQRPLPVADSPGISDDDMSKYSRQGNESKSDYLNRIAQEFPDMFNLEERKD